MSRLSRRPPRDPACCPSDACSVASRCEAPVPPRGDSPRRTRGCMAAGALADPAASRLDSSNDALSRMYAAGLMRRQPALRVCARPKTMPGATARPTTSPCGGPPPQRAWGAEHPRAPRASPLQHRTGMQQNPRPWSLRVRGQSTMTKCRHHRAQSRRHCGCNRSQHLRNNFRGCQSCKLGFPRSLHAALRRPTATRASAVRCFCIISVAVSVMSSVGRLQRDEEKADDHHTFARKSLTLSDVPIWLFSRVPTHWWELCHTQAQAY